jgi:DNA modification methylase
MERDVALTNIKLKNDIWNIDLDYADRNNVSSLFMSEGNIHTYPAKAVPDMVRDLMCIIKDNYKIKTVLDPFVGSGTVALETKLLGLDFYGSDLNPLAILLAKTKALTIKGTPYVRNRLLSFEQSLNEDNMKSTLYSVAQFNNIEYWFKEKNINQLSYIKYKIDCFLKGTHAKYREIFSLIVLTAFSSTVRESSLSRNDEFKLYRLSPTAIKNFNIDSIQVFSKKISELLTMIKDVNDAMTNNSETQIYLCNAKNITYLKDKKVDLIMTSPPYGDSQSTVAYGQFSRLSLQWMSDLMCKYLKIMTKNENCDEYLLGGKYSIEQYSKENAENILAYSKTLGELIKSTQNVINKELKNLEASKEILLKFLNELEKSDINILFDNKILSELIKERIRLEIFRKNNENDSLDKKEIKELTKQQFEKFIEDLNKKNGTEFENRILELYKLLPNVISAIGRKIKHLPKRGKKIFDFFIDLYKVVEQCDDALSEKGIQVWIVGHRTVLGELNVNLANILLEWFENLKYTKVALIERNCHYKRLPRRINSTITRNKGIETMGKEYVLIVQKK